MTADRLTPIAGFLVAVGVAMQAYLAAPSQMPFGSVQFWVGLGMAVAIAGWGYWTNKK